MRRVALSLCLCLIALNVNAQQRVERTLSILPVELRDGARVVELLENGEHVVLKEGSNGVTCRVPMASDHFLLRCNPLSDEALFDRLDSYVVREGMGWYDARDKVIEEIRAGELEAPIPGATHFFMFGDDFDSAGFVSLVFLPMAMARDLGMGVERDYERPYFMWEGSELAHIMIHGEVQ